MHSYTYIHRHVIYGILHTHTHIYIYMRFCMYLNICIYIIYIDRYYTDMQGYISGYIHITKNIFEITWLEYIYIYIDIDIYIYIYICIYNIHIYIYLCIHGMFT